MRTFSAASHNLMLPSPHAETTWFSCISDHATSKIPSWVSKPVSWDPQFLHRGSRCGRGNVQAAVADKAKLVSVHARSQRWRLLGAQERMGTTRDYTPRSQVSRCAAPALRVDSALAYTRVCASKNAAETSALTTLHSP